MVKIIKSFSLFSEIRNHLFLKNQFTEENKRNKKLFVFTIQSCFYFQKNEILKIESIIFFDTMINFKIQ